MLNQYSYGPLILIVVFTIAALFARKRSHSGFIALVVLDLIFIVAFIWSLII